jgi:holo-[acyl-carrier protein] synthase
MIVGIGIDAVDIHRVERMFADWGDRMLQRLFSPAELAYLATKRAPAQHLAVRLAAKEATYKALSGNDLARGMGWRDAEVVTRPSDGAPEMRLSGRAAERFAELCATSIHVSLTHSDTSAVAVVIVER